jgi:hypothetical protein
MKALLDALANILVKASLQADWTVRLASMACLSVCCATLPAASQVQDVFKYWEVKHNDVDIAITPSSNKAFIFWHVRGVQKDTQEVRGGGPGRPVLGIVDSLVASARAAARERARLDKCWQEARLVVSSATCSSARCGTQTCLLKLSLVGCG